jgi:hypothetical protein
MLTKTEVGRALHVGDYGYDVLEQVPLSGFDEEVVNGKGGVGGHYLGIDGELRLNVLSEFLESLVEIRISHQCSCLGIGGPLLLREFEYQTLLSGYHVMGYDVKPTILVR